MMTAAEEMRFMRLCHEELSRVKVRDGIGLLAEKRLHGLLKRWVCDDETCHEQKVTTAAGGKTRYVADIMTPAGEIFEIQTSDLYPLKKKIDFYMEKTDFRVTVVHPLIAEKWISWMDPVTGEVTERRRSPLRDGLLSPLTQLKPFAGLLGSPRFSLCFPVISFDEYRLRDGWGYGKKRGSHRYELIPLALFDVRRFAAKEDYAALFPENAPPTFTAAEFGRPTHLRGYDLYDVLFVFEALGVIEKSGTRGRAALYRRI